MEKDIFRQAPGEDRYWAHLLRLPLPTLSFPEVHEAPSVETAGARATIGRPLDPSTVARLSEMCNASDLLVVAFAATCVVAVLARVAAADEVALGMLGVEPDQPESIAFVRVGVQPTLTFKELYVQIRTRLEEAQQHVIADLRALERRVRSRAEHAALLQLGVSLPAARGAQRTSFATCVTLDVTRATLTLEYNAHNPARAMERILGHIATFLHGAVRTPYAQLQLIDILTEEEMAQLIDGFNSHWVPLPATSVPVLFEQHAAKNPKGVAVAHDARRVTYEELNATSNRVAGHLRDRVTPGSLIALAMNRSPELVAAILGVWKAGCAYVPLDPRGAGTRTLDVLDSAKPALTLIDAGSREAMAPLLSGTPVLDLDDDRDALLQRSAANAPLALPHHALAYVMFTSGSTGRPKGAMIEHGGMLNHVLAKIELLALNERSVVAQNASQCFDISVWQWFAPLCSGGQTMIYDYNQILDIEAFLDDVAQSVSVLEVVPSFLVEFLDSLERRPRKFRALSMLISNADTLHRSLVERWFTVQPDIPICNTWGATEASDDVSHHVMRAPPESGAVPVGRAIRNMAIYIVDSNMQPCPIGVAGEIVISGVGVGAGYLNDPERTRSAYTKDPFRPARGRMYRTGDLGRFREDGAIEFIGRTDHQVKVRGFRVELEEIEKVVFRHVGIEQALVVSVYVSNDAELHCHYTSSRGTTSEALRAFLAESLPDYMVPTRYTRWEQLPLNSNGKLDRRVMLAITTEDAVAPAARVEPRNSLESRLRDIWIKVLGKPAIGVTHDFFASGGDSMKAIRVAAEYGKGLLPLDIFSHPTIESLALHLAQRSSERTLLQLLTPDVIDAKLTIVGIPNSAGDPSSFRKSADVLAVLNPQCRLFAVALPREPLSDGDTVHSKFTALTTAVAAEIAERVSGPVFVFGQCNGSALALAVAEQLQLAGHPLAGVGAGGMLPRLQPQFKDDVFRVHEDTADALALLKKIGATLPADPDDLALFLRDFRYDAALANAYYNDCIRRIHENHLEKIRAPLYCFVGDADPLTVGYKRKSAYWHRHADDVRLVEFRGVGHYLLRDKPDELAQVWDQIARRNVPGATVDRPGLLGRLLAR